MIFIRRIAATDLTSSDVSKLRLGLAVVTVVGAGTLAVGVASLVLETLALQERWRGYSELNITNNSLTWFLQRPSHRSWQSPLCPLPL